MRQTGRNNGKQKPKKRNDNNNSALLAFARVIGIRRGNENNRRRRFQHSASATQGCFPGCAKARVLRQENKSVRGRRVSFDLKVPDGALAARLYCVELPAWLPGRNASIDLSTSSDCKAWLKGTVLHLMWERKTRIFWFNISDGALGARLYCVELPAWSPG